MLHLATAMMLRWPSHACRAHSSALSSLAGLPLTTCSDANKSKKERVQSTPRHCSQSTQGDY